MQKPEADYHLKGSNLKNPFSTGKTMRHLMLLAAFAGSIALIGCESEKTTSTTSDTSNVTFDYFQDAEFESTIKANDTVVVMFTADY